MPIFEFVCTSCGYRFEKLDRSGSGQAPQIECPACGSLDVNKQASSFAAGTSSSCSSTPSGGG